MAFKAKPEEKKAGAPEYMNTYGDMVTLLLTLFVMLFAMSTINEEKFQALAESYAGRISVISGGMGETLPETGAGLLTEMSAPEQIQSDNPSDELEEFAGTADDMEAVRIAQEETAQLDQLASDFKTYFAQEDETSGIKIDVESHFVRFTFQGGMLFDSGMADLKEGAYPALDAFSQEMLKYPNHLIRVEGHTDNVAMSSGRFPSNRHLSSARADTVVEYLVNAKGFDPMIIRSEGLGEHFPVDTNSTSEGRASNRRVEIKVYSTMAADEFNINN